MSDKTVAQHTL